MRMRNRGFRHYTALLLATVSLPLPAFSQQVLPSGGNFTSGSGNIQTAPSGLLINQTSATGIVEWQDFSIGSGASVHFDNGAGATLNRVTGNLGSQIDGSLTATGSLYLFNRAGIVVGKNGVVSTGGDFFASTHDVTDSEFLAGGAMTFSGSSKAAVVNLGTISSASGDVALIARAVDNSGSITAENGTVGLLAGYEILAKDEADADGLFAVVVGGSDTEASNSGAIAAANAELRANGGNVYALAGNSGGVVKATGVTSKDGRIFLTAGEGGKVEVTGKLAAARPQTASASLPTRVPVPQARPESGGDIRISGSEVTVNGTVEAKGTTGSGGTVVVTGDRIALGSAATVDASGTTGGTVLIGGDYQGGYNASSKFLEEAVATADKVAVAAGAAIRVDGTAGAGGRAVVWSDDTTIFNGTITATGAGTAAGGIVETSGHNLVLGDNVSVSTLSEQGTTGTWLIDPYNVTISSSGSGNVQVNVGSSPWVVSPTASGANINTSTLNSYLASNNVTITTNGAGSEAGNITVNADILWYAATTLSLLADATTGGIFINDGITGMSANSALVLSAGAGGITQTAAIVVGTLTATTANGGSVILTNTGNAVTTLGASSASGSFAFTNGQSLNVTGAITSNGTLGLTTTAGDLTISAALSDSHTNAAYSLSAASTLKIAKDLTLSGTSASLSLEYGTAYSLANGARVSLPGASSSFSVNGTSYTLIRDVAGLQGIGSTGYYALASDIDASATASWNAGAGFVSIDSFYGIFTGLGHAVDGLVINQSGTSLVGLFSQITWGSVRDLTLSNASVSGYQRVGILGGWIENSIIANVHITGNVSAYGEVGAIAGWLGNTIVSGSSSTASVTATSDRAGGLVGYLYGTTNVSNSYATGSVSAVSFVGGLFGRVDRGDLLTLANVYASGAVTGTWITGGIVGDINNNPITAATGVLWDSVTTGQSVAAGTWNITATAITDANSRNQATYSGFDFTNTWVMIEGETRPMLRSEYSTAIYTPHALQLMTLDLSASYTLGTNLLMTSAFTADSGGHYADVWGSSGFVSVGNYSTPFTGSFNGQGHTITGLTINRAGTDYVGLFGSTNGADIRDVTLTGGTVSGQNYVGALAGLSIDSTISNVHASVDVTGTFVVGGLVGDVESGTISGSHASGDVNGSVVVGGLVGNILADGSVSDSYATGAVGGDSTLGGLVGANDGIITASYATGPVTGTGYYVGGLVGDHTGNSISISYATGAVIGGDYVGGLVGSSLGGISQSHATGAVTGATYVGGLVGNLSNNGGSSVGSLDTSYATGTVSGTTYVGGLVGLSDEGAIATSHATGSVIATGNYAGGLVGEIYGGSVATSYATGTVAGVTSVGGFAGRVRNGGTLGGGSITNSYALGAVTGASDLGGFVGLLNGGSIADSYAMGSVTGTGSNLGGLVGRLSGGSITHAYATGRVSGGIASTMGGLVGARVSGTVTESYWNTQTSGQATSAGGGLGLSTAQLQGALPTGFSSSTWGTGANLYAYFNWQHATAPVAISGIAYGSAGGTPIAGQTITAVSNNLAIGSATSGANGYYYILTSASSLASAGVFTYFDDVTTKGAAFSDVAGTNGVQNVDLYGSAINLITDEATVSATRINYLATRSSYADSDLSFLSPTSFASLTTSGGYGVRLTASSNYTLNADLGSGGSMTLSSGGTFGVAGTVMLTAWGDLTIADDIAWSDTSSLTLNTVASGDITLGGSVTATNGTLVINAAGTATTASAIDVRLFSLTSGTWRQVSTALASFNATDFRLSSGTTFLRATGGDGTSATPYELVDVYGLQGMASDSLLDDHFVLTTDIDASATASWNSGSGFASIGSTTAFTGTLDGQNHAITNLLINQTAGFAGLFGQIGGSVSNLALSGSVSGSLAGLLAGYNYGSVTSVIASGTASAGNGGYIGGLIGLNSGTVTNSHTLMTVTAGDNAFAGGLVGMNAAAVSGGTITSIGIITGSSANGNVSAGDDSTVGGLVSYNTAVISSSYAAGAVTGGTNAHVGGLVGDNQFDSLAGTTGAIDLSFATGAATSGTGATATAGGLVGFNAGDITNTYATGNISGGQVSGGLVGINNGSIANSYSTGTVPSSAAPFGGLVGNNSGSVTASFWNTTTSGTTLGAGIGSATGMTGITTAQMSTLSTFTAAGWDISGIGGDGTAWRIYEGHTGPLLRAFMTALTVTGGTGTKTYNGTATSTNVGTLTYSTPGYDASFVLGSATYTASSANAGSYSGSGLTLSGLYSSQFGYDITTVSGSLTINKATLNVTARDATKTYDGTAYSGGNGVSYTGFVNNEDTSVLGGTLTYGGTSQGAVNVGSYSLIAGGLTASNYSINYLSGTLSVSAAPITVTADAQTMTYGNGVLTLTYAVTSGTLFGTDTISGSLATTASSASNVGTYAITQGTLANTNYAITYVGANLSVTPRAITVTANSGASMIYGDSVPTLTYSVTSGNLVNADTLSGALATTASSTSNVGTYAITQGTLAASSNYALTYVGDNVSVTPRTITVTANNQSMIYGNSVPTLTYAVGGLGLVGSDTLSGALATTATSTSNIGTYAITQGTLGNANYAITYGGANVSVTPRAITVTANNQSMAEGAAVPSLTYTVGGLGLAGSDSLTGMLATLASSTSAAGGYAITQGTLAASANYTLAYSGGTLTVTAGPTVPTTPTVPSTPSTPSTPTPTAFPASTVFEQPSSITLGQPAGATATGEDATTCPAGAVMGAACADVPHPVNRSPGQYIIIGSL